jgi:hypothetical protein
MPKIYGKSSFLHLIHFFFSFPSPSISRSQAQALGTQISGEALLRHLIASSPADKGPF